MIYTFTDEDKDLIKRVAHARHRTEGERPDADLLGAAGEVAFSRAFDLHDPNINAVDDAGWDFRMPDRTDITVDVKTITDLKDNLLVPKMGRAGCYVLVYWDREQGTARFLGWISGGEAKVYGKIAPWGKHYIVDRQRLHDWSIFYEAHQRVDESRYRWRDSNGS